MYIREARSRDNQDLQALQARCPQGTSLIVSTVNKPDFFARAKAYEQSKVFVACEDDQIVGSGACAVKAGMVDDKRTLVGYLFQAFVAPEHRRKGIATQLLREREDYLASHEVGLIYTLILEGNVPSMRYIESQGYDLKRTVLLPGLAVKRKMEIPSRGRIRPATSRDLGPVAELLNETWAGYQFYEPSSAESLAAFIARTPAFSAESLVVLEHPGQLLACLGFWDWSQVMEITVQALNLRLKLIGWLLVTARVLPIFPGPGDVLRQMMLTRIGFKDPADLTPLVRYVNNLAVDKGIQQIYVVSERDHPLLESTRRFTTINTTVHVYTKSLDPVVQFGEQPVFIDGIDL